jgi:hypothetical protein
VVCVWFVSVLVIVTVAFGKIAPDGSVILPRTPPVTVDWAKICPMPTSRQRSVTVINFVENILVIYFFDLFSFYEILENCFGFKKVF